MSDANLAGALPAGDKNGLAALAPSLVNQPDELRLALITFRVSKLTTTVEDGNVVPTVRIQQFEPVTASGDVDELRRLLRRQYERRTGQAELPLELERELDELGRSIDLSTGEVGDMPTGPEWGDTDDGDGQDGGQR